jgi:hypothetical protein
MPPHPNSGRSILILFPTKSWGFQMVSFPQSFTPKPCMHLSPPPYGLHVPSHLFLLDLIIRITFGEEYRSLSSTLCSFLHSCVTSSHLGLFIFLSNPFSNTLSLSSSLKCERPCFTPIHTDRPIIVQYTLIFIFSDRKLEDKRFCTER